MASSRRSRASVSAVAGLLENVTGVRRLLALSSMVEAGCGGGGSPARWVMAAASSHANCTGHFVGKASTEILELSVITRSHGGISEAPGRLALGTCDPAEVTSRLSSLRRGRPSTSSSSGTVTAVWNMSISAGSWYGKSNTMVRMREQSASSMMRCQQGTRKESMSCRQSP